MRTVRGGRPGLGLACASPAAAGLVGMAEAAAVIVEATPNGEFSVSSLYGIGQLTRPLTSPAAVLNGWAREQGPDNVSRWLLAHLAFDVLFVAGYGLLAVILIGAAKARIAAVRAAAERDAAGPPQTAPAGGGAADAGTTPGPGRAAPAEQARP